MRILAITNLYPNPWQPNRGPFNRQQFEALGKLHELRIIAPIAWTDELAAKARGRKAAGGARTPESAQGVMAQRRISDGILVEHPRYLFPPKVFRGWHGHCFKQCVRPYFARVLKEFNPDVVLASWAYPDGWAAVELGHAAGLPVAIKVHGSDVLLLKRDSARYKRTVEALNRADAVIAVSRHLAGEVIKLGVDPNKVNVVYNGVDCNLFFPGSREEARRRLGLGGGDIGRSGEGSDQDHLRVPLLLFVGNLVHVKGPDILIEACNLLARRGLDFECRLIGEGGMKNLLERRILEYGLQEKVKLMGPSPLKEMPDWYRAADLLVVPSRSEGLPNVVLEAMACNTPVIGTNVGGMAEFANGYVVPADDVDGLMKVVEKKLLVGSSLLTLRRQLTSWQNSAEALADTLGMNRRPKIVAGTAILSGGIEESMGRNQKESCEQMLTAIKSLI